MNKGNPFIHCGEIQENLTAFLDLELSSKERESVKEHLLICPACIGEFNELKKVGQWAQLVQAEPDLYFQKQVYRLIRSGMQPAEAEGHSAPWGWNLFYSPSFKKGALAFVFLLTVVSAYFVGYFSRPLSVADNFGIPRQDLEKINQEIDFYKDYEMIHQLDLLKKMDQKNEDQKL
jgi:hypothetical protein